MAYTIQTSNTLTAGDVVNFPRIGKSLTHPESQPLVKFLDDRNPHDLVMYPDVQRAINQGKITITQGNDEIKHLSLRALLTFINEKLRYQDLAFQMAAPGALIDNTFPFQIGGVSGNNVGIMLGKDWEVTRINIVTGTAPSTGPLVLRGFVDGANQGNISLANGVSSDSIDIPNGIPVGAGEIFNIRVMQANLASDVIIFLEGRFLVG